MNMETRYFAQNWAELQTLGEGAFGKVILIKHRISSETLAVKIIDVEKHEDAKESSCKESRLHKCLKHPNIIQFLGQRNWTDDHPFTYLYLEYAAGGELFNRVEPDIGMGHADAQRYMKQLLDGLEYIHKRGISHRDIKPENLLLDAHDNIKISDFGLATLFRMKGRERLLTRSCGTLPYVAPEVLSKSYHAVPADIWSCGIVLITLVAGELPWDKPSINCQEYENWITDEYLLQTPWSKLDNVVLNLAKKILNPDPRCRHTIEQIKGHSWMLAKFSILDSTDVLEGTSSKTLWRCPSTLDGKNVHDPPSVTLSQPVQLYTSAIPQNINELLQQREGICFSQPTQNDDHFTSLETITFSQNQLSKSDFKHLIQRMTRFFVKTNCEKSIEIVGSLLDSMHYTWNIDPSGVFTISTVDGRKMQLIFKANFISMDGKLLLDFRLYKGCGLEFKRRFNKIKQCLLDMDIILNVP